MKLDPFYLIIDSADWIERLVPLGVKLVQLRIKNKDTAFIKTEILRAKNICEKYGCELIINDYWQSAIDTKCAFIHLGQEDLDGADIAAIRRAGLKFGISTHSDEELDRALSFSPSYIALGPIYPTILKKMKWAPQGLAKLGLWKKKIETIPLVGIGGITTDRVEGVLNAGADSAAVVSDIILNENPENRVKEWLKATEKWR